MHVGVKAQCFLLLNMDHVFHQWLTKIACYSSARRLLETNGGNCSLHPRRGAVRAHAHRPVLGPRQRCKGHRHAGKESLTTCHGKKRRKPRTAPVTQKNQGKAWDLRRAFCCSELHTKAFYTEVSSGIRAFRTFKTFLSLCPLVWNLDIPSGLSQEYCGFMSKCLGLLKLQKKTRVLSSAKMEEMRLFPP